MHKIVFEYSSVNVVCNVVNEAAKCVRVNPNQVETVFYNSQSA